MKSRGAMHGWGEGREEGLERLRREAMVVLTGLWTIFFVAACFQLVAMGSAWSGEPTTITGVALENVGPEGSMVRLVVKTNTGLPVDADKVLFKVKKRVVRVTFSGVPLDSSLGQEVIFDAEAIKRVEKGYAIPDGEEQSLVRLRFDDLARTAIQGHTIESAPGGFAVIMPFGNPLPASDSKGAQGAAEVEGGELEEGSGHEAAFQALADELDADEEGDEEGAEGDEGEAQGTPLAGALAGSAKNGPGARGETPLELSDPASSPSMTRVAGSMMVVILLILGLAMMTRRMRGEGGAPWQAPTKAVKVLSTHRLTRGVQLLIVDILGDVVVLALGQGRLSMLYKVPEVEQARYRGLEQNNVTMPVEARAEMGASLGALLGRLGLGAASTDESQDFDEDALDASAGTLEALAASLDAKLDGAVADMATPAKAEGSALESVLKSADMEMMRQMGEVLEAKLPSSPHARAAGRNSMDRITPRRVLDDESREEARPKRASSQFTQVSEDEKGAETADFESFLERRLAQRNRRAEQGPAPRAGVTGQGRAPRRAGHQSDDGAPSGPSTLPVRRKLANAEQEPVDDVTRSIRNRARALGRL